MAKEKTPTMYRSQYDVLKPEAKKAVDFLVSQNLQKIADDPESKAGGWKDQLREFGVTDSEIESAVKAVRSINAKLLEAIKAGKRSKAEGLPIMLDCWVQHGKGVKALKSDFLPVSREDIKALMVKVLPKETPKAPK